VKNRNLFKLTTFLFTSSLLVVRCEGQGSPEAYKLWLQIDASLDLIHPNNSGPSFVDVKDRPAVRANFGMLVYALLANNMGSGKTNSSGPTSGEAYLSGNDRGTAGRIDGDQLYVPKEINKEGYLYVSGELEFIGKAAKESLGVLETTIGLNYLEVPLLINYAYLLDNASSVHAGFGPYAAMGLYGSFKNDGTKTAVHFGPSANSDDFKRMDYGLDINLGYRFLTRLDATVAYELGMRNVSATPPDPDTKIRGFALKIGYTL
jgi:hypothetical protein